MFVLSPGGLFCEPRKARDALRRDCAEKEGPLTNEKQSLEPLFLSYNTDRCGFQSKTVGVQL